MTNPDLRKPAGFGIYTQVWGSELRKAARYAIPNQPKHLLAQKFNNKIKGKAENPE